MPTPIKAGEVFDTARFLLNDTAGQVFTDEVLKPALKLAMDDLRLECEDNNIPYTNLTSAAITVPAGITNIGGDGGPALPADLIEIVEMYERTAGTTTDFMMMRRRNFLPKTEYQTTFLQVYTWQNQTVQLIGATGDIEVKFDYVGNSLSRIVDGNTEIRIYNSISFLGFRTAALAASYIGENEMRADGLNREAVRCIETLENIGIKNQQSIPIRRRPFMSSYRNGGWGGGMRSI